MAELATTRMSSKGQVVIPEEIRQKLRLSSGVEFLVIGSGDSIILKAISAPPISEFKDLLTAARKAAQTAKLKPKNIQTSIRRSRKTS